MKTLLKNRELSAFFAIVALFVVLVALNPAYFSLQTLAMIFASSQILCLLALGATLVMLTRNIDVSVGSTVGLCAIAVGVALNNGYGLATAIAFALAIGALAGAFNGLLVVGLRIPAIVATLGTLGLYRGVMLLWTGGKWIEGLPDSLKSLSEPAFIGVSPLGWLVLALLPVLFALWEGLTAKTALLPVPFFAPPQALVEVLHDDWPRLLDSLLHSLGLLGLGVLLGTSCGFISGLAIGWSQRIGYWVHPILRLLGPVPSTALLPLCLFIFPSSFGASVFLIALSTWFPVTVLTWSGVIGIDKAWYDVARTLGASQRFLILRVAIPAALPNVFVGLFMGLGASFSVLIVAEMVGVKSGIGFYLQWAGGLSEYVRGAIRDGVVMFRPD